MNESFEARWPAASSPIRRRMWDVFISHTREDADVARDLAVELEGRGLSTWIDAKLKSGDPLRVIDEALHSSGTVIVLLSKSSMSSRWITREVEAALKGLPSAWVIPIAVGELDVKSLPPWLADRRYLHLRDRTNVRKLIDQLLPQLRAALGDQVGEPSYGAVIGSLPPREPVVGVGSYLRELLASRAGVTWIVGVAGMGKTALAREYIHQVRADVAFVLWIDARSAEAVEIENQLREVAVFPSTTGKGPGVIVLDGLDEFVGDSGQVSEQLISLGTDNRVLITTRRLNDTRLMAAHPFSVLTVGALSQAAVADYLDTRVPELSDRQRTQLIRMLDAAGGSPLVLRLLINALRTHSLDDLLDLSASTETTLARSVAIVQSLLTPGQRQRLDVLAFCAELLPVIRRSKRWRMPEDDELFDELLRLGLVNASADGSIFAHSIVVSTLRQSAPRKALENALAYVARRLPDPDEPDSREVLSSVVELTELADLDWDPAVSASLAELLIWLASAWRTNGDFERAELLCPRALERATESQEKLLLIRALNLQSALAFDRGRIVEASEVERRTVDLASSSFGPKHPITTASLANLAVSLRALGDLPEAITLLRRVVEQNRMSLPSDHPDVIGSQISLAICLREAGLSVEALTLLKYASTHSADTQAYLRLSQILAATLTDLGRSEEALTLLRESLSRAESSTDFTLRSQSMEVLTTRASLAMVCARLGDMDEALRIQTDVTDRFEVILGPHHPSTLNARNNQAVLLARVGQSQDAMQLFLQVADDRSKWLGPDHPDALHSRLLAARALRDAGLDERAFDLYSELVGRVVQTLGPNHAMSLTVREEVAHQLGRVGNLAGSRLAHRELLADLEQVLPSDHPMVQRVRARVAHAD